MKKIKTEMSLSQLNGNDLDVDLVSMFEQRKQWMQSKVSFGLLSLHVHFTMQAYLLYTTSLTQTHKHEEESFK